MKRKIKAKVYIQISNPQEKQIEHEIRKIEECGIRIKELNIVEKIKTIMRNQQ